MIQKSQIMKNFKSNKITFFYNNKHEKYIFDPISEIFRQKKINFTFSKNHYLKSDIGFYCRKPKDINSKTSVIFLGGIDQGRVMWPNIWREQPWNEFDIGFLPGDNWANRWKQSSYDYRSQTKFGVFNVGWPKADFLFNLKENKNKIKRFKKRYKINENKINILYAPSFECFDRQIEVAEVVKKLGFNLIVKHWLEKREKKFKDLWDNIERSNKKTLEIYKKKTTIIQPGENFLTLLNFVNLIVTDESSVAYEALLKNIPTISVKDWLIQRHKKAISRYVKPADITIKTKKKFLGRAILKNIKIKKDFKLKKKEFSNLGKSSKIVVEILLNFLKDRKSVKKTKYYLKPKTQPNFFKKIKKLFK